MLSNSRRESWNRGTHWQKIPPGASARLAEAKLSNV